ncbi:MAG: hypothetical protein HY908_09785 [Myxococcales bacterium]|nr:hypothetical protein [Myxococcales bacterium]MCC6527969.1 hypothetical protein [Polyangiaceae bacterium]
MSPTESRRALLNDGALAIASSWAQVWCDNMRREGRMVAGGWPGTLPEARARVTAHFDLELRRLGLRLLTYEELEWVTQATYRNAKRAWNSAH